MTDNLKLNVDAYLPLRDVVFHTLREAILKGELKPGERLMELQLASKLGSPPAVYEILHHADWQMCIRDSPLTACCILIGKSFEFSL